MAFMALLSLMLVRRFAGRKERVEITPLHLRGFKGEEFYSTLELFTRNQRWISVEIPSVEAPLGVEVRTDAVSSTKVKLVFRPRFASGYRSLRVNLELRDILGLFARPIELLFSDFTIEALPAALLTNIPKPRPFLLALGERTAGSKGAGQEFYSIDDYQPFSETKDVLWKRVARNPDERLLIRIRESNIPKKVRIGVLEISDRSPIDRLHWIDLVSEGVGLLGRNLLAARCNLEILHTSANGAMEEVPISTLEELADSLIPLSVPHPSAKDLELLRILNEADIVVTGLREIEDMSLSLGVSRKPSLLIDEEASPILIGEQSLIFSGTEDIRKLVARAVEK